MTTRWYPLEINNLHVTSTLQVRYSAWKMGVFGFENVG